MPRPPLQAIPLVMPMASVRINLQPQLQYQMMEELIHHLALEITIQPALETKARVLKVLCNFINLGRLGKTFSCSVMHTEEVKLLVHLHHLTATPTKQIFKFF